VRRVLLIVVCALLVLGLDRTTSTVNARQDTTVCASDRWLAADIATPTAASSVDVSLPVWMTTPLIDACSGTSFTLAELSGKTLYIEQMATWCVNCHGQLTRAKEAVTQLPPTEQENVVLIALSSEVDLPREDLASYVQKNDFPYISAVMSADYLRAMAEDLGREVAVPPAMPFVLVAPDGTISNLYTGGTSSEELLALIAAAQTGS
jgi:hypothetical protein